MRIYGLSLVLLWTLSCQTAPDPDPAPTMDAGAQIGEACAEDPASISRPLGWTVASHCPKVDANYAKLFNDEVVHRFDITITPAIHQQMMDDLSDKLSGGGARPGAEIPNPIWVKVGVEFDGQKWWDVGMRYKGNSSLKSAWLSGVRKIAFRLHFDRFADNSLMLADQRFFGFRKMTFSNAYNDRSLIRDKMAGDIFRQGGVPAARAAFARIFVDHGEGPVYFGLYTMIEDPSDEMLSSQYTDDSGNLYKPSGDAASWAMFDEETFEKKTNSTEADFSDVIAAVNALNADRTDSAQWKAEFEKHFDVPAFLKYLAINQAMVNWDSYGFMPHNYYVYGDPSDGGRLTWFPWDLNESMLYRRGPGANAGSVMLDEITEDWPLVRFLLDDPGYRDVYKAELQAALNGTFAITTVHAKMDAYHNLIAPYVTGPDGESSPYTFLDSAEDFETSLTSGDNALKPHVEERHRLVNEALGL